jgi:hypothetical protein
MRITTPQEFLDWPKPEKRTWYPKTELMSLREAVERTLPNVETYLDLRNFKRLGTGEEPIAATLKLGIGRLEWLLDEARQEISGLFTMDEFTTMLNFYLGSFLTPLDCYSMAQEVCDCLSVEWEDRGKSVHADFINRLDKLSMLQRAALGDALEVAWNSASPFEVLEDMYIVFK